MNIHNIVSTASENIAMEMGRRRMSALELSKKCNLGAATVSNVKRDTAGTSNPKIETLLLIWVVGLEMDENDLFRK